MTCPNATSAELTHRYCIDDRGGYPTYPPTSADISELALITRVMQRLAFPPPLVLTTAHQRQALIVDRDKAAKRMDAQQVHRLEGDLRKLTNRILRGN
jgi:hypothetical protein